MSLSMYQASVPAFIQMLNNLSAILNKAEADRYCYQAPSLARTHEEADIGHDLLLQIEAHSASALVHAKLRIDLFNCSTEQRRVETYPRLSS